MGDGISGIALLLQYNSLSVDGSAGRLLKLHMVHLSTVICGGRADREIKDKLLETSSVSR
jgi:hypothetical protein